MAFCVFNSKLFQNCIFKTPAPRVMVALVDQLQNLSVAAADNLYGSDF